MELIEYERRDLYCAIEKGNVEEVYRLTKNLNNHSLISWRPGFNLLCQSITNKNLEISKMLINHGCRITAREEEESVLHLAILHGDFEIIKLLNEKGCSFKFKSVKEISLFHMFAKRRPVDQETALILDYFLQNGININLKHSCTRFTLLHFAAEYGNLEMISLLLMKNANLEGQANRNHTPLHIAALNGQAEAVQLLLNSGAQYIVQDYFEKTPLCLAVEKEDMKTIQTFLDFFSDCEPKSKQLTPIIHDHMLIYCATATGNKSLVEMFLLKGANPNRYWMKFGETPLHLAVEKGYEDIVRILLEHGAVLNQEKLVTSRGSTELHIAAEMSREEIFKVLLKHGADPGKMNERLLNPLHIATEKGFVSIAKAILKSGYDIPSMLTADLVKGRNPLHYAVKYCNEEITSLILDQGVSVNLVDNYGFSPLHLATRKGDRELVQLLLNHGANVNAQYFNFFENKSIPSPFYYAAELGNIEILEKLCKASMKWKYLSEERYTAIYIAAYNGHEKFVKYLLENGVDPNNNYDQYLSPLHVASQQGHLNIVNLLLLYGAEVNPKRNKGVRKFSTPLIAAAFSGHEAIVEVLLNHGANVNARMNIGNINSVLESECFLKYGYTYDAFQKIRTEFRNGFKPIHCAASNGKKKIIEMLLKNGAYVNSRTGNNTTPLSVAVEKEHEEAVACLLESGARIDLEVYDQYPFFAAIRKKNLSIVKLIYNYIDSDKFASNSIMENACTPLFLAVIEQAPDIVDFFLKNGAHPDFYVNDHVPMSTVYKSDIRNEFPLHVAVEAGNEYIVKSLIEFGASVNSICMHGLTPLFHALKAGRIENFKFLLEKGAPLHEKNSEGESLLHFAIGEKLSPKIIKFLLECGVLANIRCNGYLPIDYLCVNNDSESDDYEPGKSNSYKKENEEDEILNLLLMFGTSPKSKKLDIDHQLIFYDSEFGLVNAVRYFLLYGADINMHVIEKSPLYKIYSSAFRLVLNGDSQDDFNLDDEETCKKFDLNSNEWRRHCPYENFRQSYTYFEYNKLIREAESYREIAKLWISALAKLNINQIVNYPNLNQYTIFKRFYLHCQEEVKKMKNTFISNRISFFDILTTPETKLSNYTRNSKIIETMEYFDYHELFPLYAEELTFRMKRGIQEQKLIKMSVDFLNEVLKVKLPILVVYEIFSYLDTADLQNLCRIYDRFIFLSPQSRSLNNF